MSQTSAHSKNSPGWFNLFAAHAARVVGSPYAFLLALASIALWLIVGPRFHWSNAWQLVVNSLTNAVTYLVVFIIQNSQNRDSEAINLKLNELIAAGQASNELINVENLNDSQIDALYEKYERIREEWRRRRK